MNTKIKIVLWVLVFLLSPLTLLNAQTPPHPEIDPATSLALKKYMMNLSLLLSDLEAEQGHASTADWKIVQDRIKKMNQDLSAMKKTDSHRVYENFTDSLGKTLQPMELLAERKDPKVFDKIAELKNACFKCHAAHHAGGYFNKMRPSTSPSPSP